jgi:hypothetical protein
MTDNAHTPDEPPLTDAQLADFQQENDFEFVEALHELRAKSRFTPAEVDARFGGGLGERRMFERNPDPKLSEMRRYLWAVGAYVEHKIIESP